MKGTKSWRDKGKMCVGLEMRQYVFNYTGNDTGNDDDPHSPSIGFFFNYNNGSGSYNILYN